MTERQEPNSGTAKENEKPEPKRRRKKKSSKHKIEPHFSPATIKALKEHLLKNLQKLDLKNMKIRR